MKALGLLLLVLNAAALAEPAAPATAVPTTQADSEAQAAPATQEAQAAETPAAPPYAAALRAQATQILKSAEFQQFRESRKLVMRDWLRRWLGKKEKKEPEATGRPLDLSGVAQVLKILLSVLLAVALFWLLWRGWRWLGPDVMARAAPQRALPDAQALPLSPEPLPAAVSAAARAAWQRGDAVLALSLLYRGAVRALGERYRIELPASATEGECLRLAQRSGTAVASEAFAPIVRAWTALAYARRSPEDFDALATLYARHFEHGGGES